ncbi:MAG: ATP-dependent DNA ligase [Nocardioides sp.]|nr:ATP-dependent DNA ligase [Nocardioides sp.]
MQLSRIVATSSAVAATRSRTQKTALLADLLRDTEPTDVGVVASYLAGVLRQRRTGLGWRTVAEVAAPQAEDATLTAAEVDDAFAALQALAGPGSQQSRREGWAALLARATEPEQAWLRAMAVGEVRQGALDALLLEAVAQATTIPLGTVRRAAMLTGSSVDTIEAAVAGGAAALEAVRLEVGRPVRPMLAASASDLPDGLDQLARQGATPYAVDAKLDGIRVQVHRDGDLVRVFTRSLDDITARVAGLVEAVRALSAERLVLDGEALLTGPDGRPRPFQETASRSSTRAGTPEAGADLVPAFFDVLHLDGRDLLDEPAITRWAVLDTLVPPHLRVDRLVTDDPAGAQAFADDVLAAGHEGVVLKNPSTPYEAGRRGAGWIKVKPRHTLDLVVLAVEWGSGRRQGLLSNIHLGARDADGSPVMLGKTFKGLTDAVLAWQTERFLELETHREGHVVHVRPEQVVEVAFDGVQRSTRYPGGVALRFARVVRYREDKAAAEVDTIDTVRAHLGPPEK